MLRLHHFQLSPLCRKVRLVLNEKRLPYECVVVRPWDAGIALKDLTKLALTDGHVLTDARAIAEYLEETSAGAPLLAVNHRDRAEARSWINWADDHMWSSVTSQVLQERVLKRFDPRGDRQPDLTVLKAAQQELRACMQVLERQLDHSASLVGGLGLADLSAAAHLSCLDYFGDVPWSDYAATHDWYARIKSRPSFRVLLSDTLPGVPHAAHYQDLDF
jgi:glutathione S-transferase